MWSSNKAKIFYSIWLSCNFHFKRSNCEPTSKRKYLHAGCCKKEAKGWRGEIVELYICADFVKDNNEASVVVNVDSSNHPGDLLKSNPDSNR